MTLTVPNTIKIITHPNPAAVDFHTTKDIGNYTYIKNDQLYFPPSTVGDEIFTLASIEKSDPAEFQNNLSRIEGIREIAFFPHMVSIEIFEAFTQFQQEIINEVISIMKTNLVFKDANIFKTDGARNQAFGDDDFSDDQEGRDLKKWLTGWE